MAHLWRRRYRAVVAVTEVGPLRRLLEETAAAEAVSMKALTVLAAQNDPFRVDTPAGHRDGEWLAINADSLGLGDRKIHLRGLHYMVLGRPKPNGDAYANTEADWTWLSATAGKAARWLGYLPFDQIVDQRNSAPTIRLWRPSRPYPYVDAGVDVTIPDVEDLAPHVGVLGFEGSQPYKLVMVGEKSSLGEVLAPVAEHFKADLYLPTGEISDTLVYQMARVGAEDGRPMVVLYFADADPAGWQMGISVGRKLQAFRALHFAELDFRVQRVALTPAQVGEYGLPSTPLKETEKRADAWRAAMGIDQTEIDALAALQPQLLQQLAREAIAPYFDRTLDGRVWAAHDEWQRQAQAALAEQMDEERLEQIRAEATEKLSALREEIDALNTALQVDAHDLQLQLPEPVVPAAELNGSQPPEPLIDSSLPFAEQCRRLLASKEYRP